MSDNCMIVVPVIPEFIPAPKLVQRAKKVVQEIAPEADEISLIEGEQIRLFDCGSNLLSVSCPKCSSPIEFDWWSSAMSSDYHDAYGFQLKSLNVPCCGANVTLNQLRYDSNQAFGKFALRAMNPGIEALSDEETGNIESALGCKVSVVYQHL